MACDLTIERQLVNGGFPLVCGVDEVGRGALAGPVVAAAVIFNFGGDSGGDLRDIPAGINDSKRLTKAQRLRLAAEIRRYALAVAVARVESAEIDRINILKASLQAMREAVKLLQPQPAYALIDGNQPIPQLLCPQRTIVKGDSLSTSIAAASIIAKVARDQLMSDYDREFPGYGFAAHVGYGTPLHQQAITRLGPSPIHRMTFRGVLTHQASLLD